MPITSPWLIWRYDAAAWQRLIAVDRARVRREITWQMLVVGGSTLIVSIIVDWLHPTSQKVVLTNGITLSAFLLFMWGLGLVSCLWAFPMLYRQRQRQRTRWQDGSREVRIYPEYIEIGRDGYVLLWSGRTLRRVVLHRGHPTMLRFLTMQQGNDTPLSSREWNGFWLLVPDGHEEEVAQLVARFYAEIVGRDRIRY